VREDHALEPPQLRSGLDSELVHQHLAALPHRLECLRLASRAVQRDHQLSAQTLAQRVLCDERLQFADQVLGTPAGQLRGHPLLDRLYTQVLQARDLALSELIEAIVGQRLAAPQRQGRLEVGGGALRIVATERHPRPPQKLLEAPGIDR
jgi:ABC-type phosphate transport system auxiliary subunit